MDEGKLIAVIGDEDTVTGFLLAGIGERDGNGANFLTVTSETKREEILAKFHELIGRNDVAILLINQHIANIIREAVANYAQVLPTILEIPSKEHPYDEEKDSVLKKVNLMLGGT